VRLEAPSREHRVRDRIMHRLARLRVDAVPDIVLACQHRREFFGEPFLAWVETSLRGPSEWSQGDRELMAVLVSDRNRCTFCVGTHAAPAGVLVGDEAVQAVLRSEFGGANGAETDGAEADGAETDGGAEMSAELRATLAFVEKLSLSPTEVDASDVERAVAAGASPQQLRDAVEVCAAFNVINRFADALAFEDQDEKSLALSAKMLTKRGYRF
jgi:uncharacterized peroxidase-related enzyme